MNAVILFCLLFLIAPVPGRGEASVEAILAKARVYLGGEEALNRIESIHYTGTFENFPEGVTGEFDIFLKKPLRQRVDIRTKDLIDTTVLDGFEGWRRLSSSVNPDEFSIQLLGSNERRKMRFNTWENLNFFSGIERLRGKIVDHGTVLMDGEDCYMLEFVYDEDNRHWRYFSIMSGQLVATESLSGSRIREHGSIMVEGVRFPRQVDTYVKGQLVTRLRYDEVSVNADFPDELFAFPEIKPPSLGGGDR